VSPAAGRDFRTAMTDTTPQRVEQDAPTKESGLDNDEATRDSQASIPFRGEARATSAVKQIHTA